MENKKNNIDSSKKDFCIDLVLNELEGLNDMLILMQSGLDEFGNGEILSNAFYYLYTQYAVVLKKLRALTDC